MGGEVAVIKGTNICDPDCDQKKESTRSLLG